MDPKRLREQTRAEHEATEAAVPLMGPGLTLERYCEVLELLLPLVASWEDWASAAAPRSMQSLVRARRRSHLLEQDLMVLSPGTTARRMSVEVPDWEAVVNGEAGSVREAEPANGAFQAAFVGAMYVMEGSTLGGRFVAKHVESALGLTPGEGNAYFEGHGSDTGRLWREVTAEIAAVPEQESPVVIEAARRAFVAFRRTLEQGLRVP